MSRTRSRTRLLAGAGWLAGLCLSTWSDAAPKPLPDLTPEEIQLRALVEPLREGVTEGTELKPLLDWLDAREAAGKGREVERDLRRVLKRIDDDCNKDLLRAAEWVRVLQIQRSRLYIELSEDLISLKRAVENSEKFAPVPVEEELLPGHAEISDAFLAGAMGTAHRAAPADDNADNPADEALPKTDEAGTNDLDAPRLMDRLTLDLTALQHLLHECDNEYEREKERHRVALEALTTVLNARRAATRQKS
jgi:hypothetical protein